MRARGCLSRGRTPRCSSSSFRRLIKGAKYARVLPDPENIIRRRKERGEEGEGEGGGKGGRRRRERKRRGKSDNVENKFSLGENHRYTCLGSTNDIFSTENFGNG